MEVQLPEFLNKRGLNFVNLKVVAVRLAAQGISHYISLAWRIGNTQVKVRNKLHPSLLTEVQIWLSKQILQTLVVSEDLATITEKVMSPLLQRMNDSSKFEVVNWVVLFVRAQLPRGISNHFAVLH